MTVGTPTVAGLVGLHGLKRRWLADTVRDGLCRSSAAWFTVATGTTVAQRRATLAACVYHALGLAVTADLAARTAPGGYRALFQDRPDQRPAILGFPDEPTGHEVWRRYFWVGPGSPGPTAPYTKVERAGRTAGPWPGPTVFAPSLATLALVESALDRHQLTHSDARLALAGDGPAPAVDTKLARFCDAVAGLAEATLFPGQDRRR